ncbi:MAG: site-specific DNA-methyltransferase [Bacteroidales bacterium]|nr:site-specific DNA-methyltransferase [Bacteroidales bacterium]
MEKLNMQTTNIVDENIRRIGELFPNCLTERLNEEGKPMVAIDFDQLRQELSKDIVEGPEERYQFTWPDKRNAIRLANAPTTDTLRPRREESVDFDTTQNLYIEGDNLQVLKLLRENYLGKVKMIYIDPPYNTGNDFVYNDDFAQSAADYVHNSGQKDEYGNRLVANTESNGRFHTDWLNMIYPRLKVAKDLLSEDGVIFISIDDNEAINMRRVCDEVFGAANFRNTIITRRRIKSLNSQFADNGLYTMNVGYEYVLVYARSSEFLMKAIRMQKATTQTKGRWDVFWSNADRPTMRYDILGFTPETGQWRNSKEKAEVAVANYKVFENDFADKMTIEEYSAETGITDFIRRIPNGTGKNGGVQHWIAPSDTMLRTSDWTDIEVSQIGKEIDLPFNNPKNKALIVELCRLIREEKDYIVLDFFSGSATTAHAVMQLNAEDGGNRKFIMVQLPEAVDEKSEAFKAGYKTICEIGKERIRRAGKKILEEQKSKTGGLFSGEQKPLDTGFRVLKLDSSNMEDVYYTPAEFNESKLFEDNVKPDRTEEDLLFQTMTELGVELSAKIEKMSIGGKNVWSVSDGYLMACFDAEVNETTITEVARRKPFYFVMRDSSLANDQVADNFEQIWQEYSDETVRRII